MKRPYPAWPLLVFVAFAAGFENFWMWGDDRLVFGLPVNLLYHLGLCAVAALAMAAIVHFAWPEDES